MREVLLLRRAGLPRQEIARGLGISEKTVKTYLYRLHIRGLR
jgi:DNA-binding CsgD family transcriptional regulator